MNRSMTFSPCVVTFNLMAALLAFASGHFAVMFSLVVAVPNQSQHTKTRFYLHRCVRVTRGSRVGNLSSVEKLKLATSFGRPENIIVVIAIVTDDIGTLNAHAVRERLV